MSKYLPLLLGLITLLIVIALPIRSKFLLAHIIVFAIPMVTYQMRDKSAGQFPDYGCLLGAIIGACAGVMIIDCIMKVIHDDMTKYSIRLDLLLGGLLGASILSSLGIIAGGWISKRKKSAK